MGVTLMRTNEEEKVVAITKISADVDKEKKDNTTKNNEKEVWYRNRRKGENKEYQLV